MEFIPDIKIAEYTYDLPQGRIAQHPLSERDEARLLIYRDGKISEDVFKNVAGWLPEGSLLIFNETRVIRARMLFTKPSGAVIEVFCLEPVLPTSEIQQAFEQKSYVTWKCMVGNLKRWKTGSLIKKFRVRERDYALTAERTGSAGEYALIRFAWNPSGLSFSEVLVHSGVVPLPPYINRESTSKDSESYQTIFAREEGSVAAPTAGLHFTDGVFGAMKKKNIQTEKVILHVGAGTFKPVSAPYIRDHKMHAEKIIVSGRAIEKILTMMPNPVVVTGTTTLRTLESLYWFGVKSLVNKTNQARIDIGQWDPYDPRYNCGITAEESLNQVMKIQKQTQSEYLSGETRLMIVPSYKFRLTDLLITNFHLPQSTLLLLVSAFAGEGWKDAYSYALNHAFRFLSYGDACLFYKR